MSYLHASLMLAVFDGWTGSAVSGHALLMRLMGTLRTQIRPGRFVTAAQHGWRSIVFDITFLAVGRCRPTKRRLLQKLFQKRHLGYGAIQNCRGANKRKTKKKKEIRPGLRIYGPNPLQSIFASQSIRCILMPLPLMMLWWWLLFRLTYLQSIIWLSDPWIKIW